MACGPVDGWSAMALALGGRQIISASLGQLVIGTIPDAITDDTAAVASMPGLDPTD
jgi:hypothetical protein